MAEQEKQKPTEKSAFFLLLCGLVCELSTALRPCVRLCWTCKNSGLFLLYIDYENPAYGSIPSWLDDSERSLRVWLGRRGCCIFESIKYSKFSRHATCYLLFSRGFLIWFEFFFKVPQRNGPWPDCHLLLGNADRSAAQPIQTRRNSRQVFGKLGWKFQGNDMRRSL